MKRKLKLLVYYFALKTGLKNIKNLLKRSTKNWIKNIKKNSKKLLTKQNKDGTIRNVPQRTAKEQRAHWKVNNKPLKKDQ